MEPKKPPNYKPYIIATAIIFGLAGIAFSIYTRYYLFAGDGWLPAKATITSLEEMSNGLTSPDTPSFIRIHYEFKADGGTHSSARDSELCHSSECLDKIKSEFPLGSQLDIYIRRQEREFEGQTRVKIVTRDEVDQ